LEVHVRNERQKAIAAAAAASNGANAANGRFGSVQLSSDDGENTEQAEPRKVELLDPVSNQVVTWQELTPLELLLFLLGVLLLYCLY